MTRDEVLEEVGILATLEHAVIVECLSVQCALGHDLKTEEGGATNTRGRDAADIAASFAQITLMGRFKDLNEVLLSAGRDARLDRAATVSSDSHPEVPLDPPTVEQLVRLIERERGIAAAVDERYTKLELALDSATGIEPELLERLGPLVKAGKDHSDAVERMHAAIGDPAPIDLLRATRRVADGSSEQRLLDLSDKTYAVLIGLLRDQLVPDVFGDQALAVKAMFTLDDANRVLVQRGLLPPFSPA